MILRTSIILIVCILLNGIMNMASSEQVNNRIELNKDRDRKVKEAIYLFQHGINKQRKELFDASMVNRQSMVTNSGEEVDMSGLFYSLLNSNQKDSVGLHIQELEITWNGNIAIVNCTIISKSLLITGNNTITNMYRERFVLEEHNGTYYITQADNTPSKINSGLEMNNSKTISK